MADLKISELNDGVSALAADELPIARNGQNYYITVQYLKNFIYGSSGQVVVATGKTLAVNNSITMNGTDGVSVDFGAGGTFAYASDGLGQFASTTSAQLRSVISDETGTGYLVFSDSPALTTPDLGTPSAATLTNATGLPLSTGITGFGTGVAAWLATPSSANLRTAVTDETGSGALVFATSPTLTTPDLGTPSAATLTNATGLPISTGVSGLGSNVATALATSVGTDGAFVVKGGALGTPSSGTLTNATGLPISTGVSGLGTGVATFLATPSSANLASAVTDETGSGALVFADSPTFTDDITLGTQSTTRGSIVFANTASGSKAVTLQSSNSTAAAYTITFPAAAPTNGYYLQTDGSGNLAWAAAGGGTGSPGGVDTNVQFNDAGSFGGDAAFTYNKSTDTVTLGEASTSTGSLKLANSGTANTVTIRSGVNTASWVMTLPTDDGASGQLLQTDGSGNLSWYTSTATGDVVGPASATDNAIARFDGTTGKLIQNSAVTVADTTGDITGGKYNGLTVSTTTGTLTVANGKTLATDNSVTFVGTDGSTVSYGTGGTIAYTSGTLAQFSSTTSSQLAGVISDETGTGSLVFSNSPTFNDDITLGVASTATGAVKFTGLTSGLVTLSVADIAGTWTLKLPTSAGSNGQALTTDGSGNAAWTTITGGATGGGSDSIFWNNGQTVTTNYTVPATTNAGTFGPITIDSGVTVTVSSGSNWTVV